MTAWGTLSCVFHLIGACAAAALAVSLLGKRSRSGKAGLALAVALSFSAAWALSAAAFGTGSAGEALAEAVRNLAWIFVVWRLFGFDGQGDLMRPVRPMVIALAGLGLFQIGLLILLRYRMDNAYAQEPVFMASIALRLLLTIGGLVLVHNLYTGASQKARLALRWPAAALALIWLFDLNLFTTAYIGTLWPTEIAALRGLVLAIAVGLLVPVITARRDELRFSPSRAFTFQFAALAGIGGYLGAMVFIVRSLDRIGGDYATLLQFSMLIAVSTLALLALPSRRVRGWIKVMLVKHLFRHRYDYRAEWLRFAQTIGRSGDADAPLEVRAIQAVAQIVDSPAGLLLVPGEQGDFGLCGQWNWPRPDVPSLALDPEAVRFFERTGFIVEIDTVRAGTARHGEQVAVPPWLLHAPAAWALVPLIQYGRLTGAVVLARPADNRRLDWEDLDLLRVIGPQLATTLSEQASHEALAEAARFDEFHRRIAFVMHDIKNLASQLGLLARNAEMHADNPAFRADMLVTLRNSADKLNALLVRLSRYRSGTGDALAPFDIGEALRSVVGHFAANPQVTITECGTANVIGNRDAFEQALIHLVQNAVDASPDAAPVRLSQTCDASDAMVAILDDGAGMSAEFIRNRLFKPFVSSKPGGFGIGAFEARELVRAMHGRLDVESREGQGTRFIVRLPLASSGERLPNSDHNNTKVA